MRKFFVINRLKPQILETDGNLVATIHTSKKDAELFASISNLVQAGVTILPHFSGEDVSEKDLEKFKLLILNANKTLD